ncbi:cystatin-F-like [Acipenser oxyrinchus oxyrinchus]|uniref:Cystatin-F-like n=1 Tax=Acipenser oxyrinchus oxyrinchus TaxID=40147 RepID=A0AAD8GAY9_ACIOX|nr:cystatin-F-like [Acipenser oxyrinchus oxyrinchus]
MKTGTRLLLSIAFGCVASSNVLLQMHKLDNVDNPGSAKPVSTNDSGVKTAVKTATYEFNNRSNDIFLFKASAIDDAKIQVVKGIKYILEVKITRTVCRKKGHPDLENCNFQPDGKLKQIFKCHFEVWAIPWLHWMKTAVLICQ